MASPNGVRGSAFRRVQATCHKGQFPAFFLACLEFEFEARLAKFGPNGETYDVRCSRIFEVAPLTPQVSMQEHDLRARRPILRHGWVWQE